MEPTSSMPTCVPAPSDTIAMVVVAGVFLLGWWLFRRWRGRGSSSRKS